MHTQPQPAATQPRLRPARTPLPHPPVSSFPAQPQSSVTPLQKLGFYCALGVIFVKFSMIHEAIAAKTGVNTRLLYVFGVPAIMALLLSGGLHRAFRHKPVWYWMGFGAWMTMAVPFSTWIGGSLPVVQQYLSTELLILFLITGLADGWADIQKLLIVMAVAAVTSVSFSKLFGTASVDAGRLALNMGASSISNSNDYAAHILIVTAFLVAFAWTSGMFMKLFAAVFSSYVVFVILSTASRGGLIALGVMSALMLLYCSMTQRFVILVSLPLAFVLLLGVLPGSVRNRLFSFSVDAKEAASESEDVAAAQSGASRLLMLERTAYMALRYPIFGVGPDQFMTKEADLSKAEGTRGYWHNAHNSYMQAAAENGLPAFVLLMAGVISTLKLLNRTSRRAREFGNRAASIAMTSRILFVGYLGFYVCIFFLNFHYKFYMPAMTGIAIALAVAAEQQFASLRRMQPQPAAIQHVGRSMTFPQGRFRSRSV